MTKEITKAIILQEMQDKLKLRDFDPANFLFDETVVPIYDISKHLRFTTATYETETISSGPTAYLFFTVPDNERWFLNGYNVIFVASGAYTVTGIYLVRQKQQKPASGIYLDMTLGQTVSYAINLPKMITLDPGDKLYVYVDSYTSTADLRLYIDYEMEEIR